MTAHRNQAEISEAAMEIRVQEVIIQLMKPLKSKIKEFWILTLSVFLTVI